MTRRKLDSNGFVGCQDICFHLHILVSLKEKGVVKSRQGDGNLLSAAELNCYIMEVLLPPQNKK